MRKTIHHIISIQRIYTLLLLLCCNTTKAQQLFCPPNLNFEQGNLSNWKFYIGNCCPINANNATLPISNRHFLTSGSDTDFYGGFPVVAPGGGTYSLKLGNDSIYKQSERARYYIKVPNTQDNKIFVYRYAVVFQNPNHSAADQPRFVVSAIDSATQAPIPCNQFTYISSSSLPGFKKSGRGTDVYYKPWTTATIDLTAYGGKTVAIDFASGDCALGAHFGYGYVDMNCGLFEVKGISCNANTTLTLTAPPGYEKYKWMDTTFTTVIDTLQNILIPRQNAHAKYAIIVTPYQGFGCEDTFTTGYLLDTVTVTSAAWPDTSVCKNKPVTLQASGSSVNQGISYKWYPSTGLSCSTCKNPVARTDTTITYNVVVTDMMGCKDTADAQVTILPHPEADAGPDKKACAYDTVMLNGKGNATSFVWYPNVSITGTNTLTPSVIIGGNLTYYLAMVNSFGCRDTDAVNVIMYPRTPADAGPPIRECKGTQSAFQASGGISYLWTPATGLSNPNIANPTLYIDTFRQYWVTVTDTNGCSATDATNISLHPTPTAYTSNDTIVCPGTAVYLQSWGGSTYSWSPNYNINSTTTPGAMALVDKKITYTVIVANTFGCKDTADITLDVLPKPSAIVNNAAACEGDTITLTAQGGGSYLWYPSYAFIDSTSPNQTLVVSASTEYSVEITNAEGCKDTAQALVTKYPKPIPDAGNDTVVCAGKTIQLHGAGGSQYLWIPGTGLSDSAIATPHVTVQEKGIYKLIVTNTFGCHDSDNIEVDIFPIEKFEIDPPSAICIGDAININARGGDEYLWYPSETLNGTNTSSTTANPSATTRYYVVVKEHLCNNKDTLSTIVTVNPLPNIRAMATDLDCGNEYGKLLASGAETYFWTPSSDLDNPYSNYTLARPAHTTTYMVEGIDKNGCKDTASTTLTVYEGNGRLYIPDAFTPNGDGINDCYRVFIPGDVTEFKFSIYNRFGERVFHTTERNHCWDGMYKGTRAELATYFYYYQAVSSVCGKAFRKGDMHLLK